MKSKPTAHVIAGPNGAGKTTFALEFLPRIADCRNFVNADLIARGLSPLDVDAAVARRRYGKGLTNLFQRYMPLADYCAIIDNSSTRPTVIYEWSTGAERVITAALFDRIRQQAGAST